MIISVSKGFTIQPVGILLSLTLSKKKKMLAKEPILKRFLLGLYYVGRAPCTGAVTKIRGGIIDPCHFQHILKLVAS